MNLQVYNIHIKEVREALPTLKYTIQVVEVKDISDYYLKETLRKFITNIENGDIILLEYPPITKRKYTGGIYTFFIKVTNLRTEKYINIPATRIEDDFWDCLKEIKVIE